MQLMYNNKFNIKENIMSVQVNQYLGYGYLIPYDDGIELLEKRHSEDKIEELIDSYNDSAYNKDIVEINGISVLFDGMNGKFIFIGKVFKKSSNYEYLETTIMPTVNKKVKDTLSAECINVFGKTFDEKAQFTLVTMYR